ncbi:hypothetical protein [Nonomuraea sp. SBT364]|uniref:hypothetical protein n=1 Tax=Nonomuraea sp. SBT364 TaxID=1580530 RepID=UPI00066B7D36|nr:hypothetical protein [Nonomuraea sp. SBT364]
MPLSRSSAGFRIFPETGGRVPLLLAALLLTGCTTPEAPPGVTSVADLVLPFDAYKPASGQRALLANAHNLLVVRCMRRHGVTVDPPGEDAAAIAAADPGNTRRYGVADPRQAAEHGYHLAGGPPVKPWTAKLSRVARRQLNGRQGCLDRADAQLSRGATKADWSWLALQDSLTLEQAAREPAVSQAADRWKACMERAGHAYPSPEAAIADRRWHLEKPEVSDEEKQTASADVACKWSSGLVAAWYAADADLQRAVVRDNDRRFAAFRDNLSKRLDRATALLT